jgi:hypothetical protein
MPVSDNTTAEGMTATSGDLRLLADFERDHIDSDNYPPKSSGAAVIRRRAARLEATADALDALREAVKGCGTNLGISLSDTCDGRPGWLCFDCEDKRDLAIRRLLGSEIEGER